MSRYTSKDYRKDLATINKNLVWDLSIEFVGYGGRYNMTYSDRYMVDQSGSIDAYGCLECGTPKEALTGAYKLSATTSRNMDINRKQAKQLLFIYGIDFDLDFYQQSLDLSTLLVKMAKVTKYRKPQNANGSLARYFYQHLKNKVKLDRHYNVNSLNWEV